MALRSTAESRRRGPGSGPDSEVVEGPSAAPSRRALPPRPATRRPARARPREMTADELNDQELRRIRLERGAEGGLYKKGGMVKAKKGKK